MVLKQTQLARIRGFALIFFVLLYVSLAKASPTAAQSPACEPHQLASLTARGERPLPGMYSFVMGYCFCRAEPLVDATAVPSATDSSRPRFSHSRAAAEAAMQWCAIVSAALIVG
jgi:hypothetical protein